MTYWVVKTDRGIFTIEADKMFMDHGVLSFYSAAATETGDGQNVAFFREWSSVYKEGCATDPKPAFNQYSAVA